MRENVGSPARYFYVTRYNNEHGQYQERLSGLLGASNKEISHIRFVTPGTLSGGDLRGYDCRVWYDHFAYGDE